MNIEVFNSFVDELEKLAGKDKKLNRAGAGLIGSAVLGGASVPAAYVLGGKLKSHTKAALLGGALGAGGFYLGNVAGRMLHNAKSKKKLTEGAFNPYKQ